ncbi:MAG: Gfo/Idh/MocA family protein [Bacteroidia bacterium]
MATPIKVGVVGVGYIGSRHLDALLRIQEAHVVGFYDRNPQRYFLAQEKQITHFPSYDALLDAVDAVWVCTDTSSHYALAQKALRAQRHVFIEKPFVTQLKQAESLLRLKEEAGVQVMIGHVERFNPAYQVVKKFAHDLQMAEFYRLAPWTPRGADVSVIYDLMLHDMDLAFDLFGSLPTRVTGKFIRHRTSTGDTAWAFLEFQDGKTAYFISSRVAPYRERKARLFTRNQWIEADWLTKTLQAWEYHQGDPQPISLPAVPTQDALYEEDKHFIHCLLAQEPPLITMEGAYAVLEIAHEIESVYRRIWS